MATRPKGIGRNNESHLLEIEMNLSEMERMIRIAAQNAENVGEFSQQGTALTYLRLADLISRTKTEVRQITM